MGCIGEYHCDFSKGTEYFTSGLDFSVRKKKKKKAYQSGDELD